MLCLVYCLVSSRPPNSVNMVVKLIICVFLVHHVCNALDIPWTRSLWEVFTGPSASEDGRLTVPQLLTKYGYPNEIHSVTTEDGYILELHRILSKKGKGPVVILIHPFLCTSAEWIINGPDKSLGYILADKGYDVWLGNIRGNTYCKKHTTLSPEAPAFWNFTHHHMAEFDLPAIADYALKTSGMKKFHYVGHSQGGLIFLLMCSIKPEYNDKVLSMNAFAPAVYLYHLKSFVGRAFFGPFGYDPEKVFERFEPKEIMSKIGDGLYKIINYFCNEKALTQYFCSSIVFLSVGFNEPQLNKSMLTTYFGHTPGGGSLYQVVHYAQNMITGELKMLDYGPTRNAIKYGTPEPPKYNLSKVTAPVALHCAANDLLIDCVDVEKVYKELPNAILFRKVPDEQFNHLDFSWAKDANVLVYDKVLEILKQYDSYS